jgi:hypothetical protein
LVVIIPSRFLSIIFISQFSRQIPTVSNLASAVPSLRLSAHPRGCALHLKRLLICDNFRVSCRAFHRASAPEGLKKDSASKAAHVYASPFSETTDWQDRLKTVCAQAKILKAALSLALRRLVGTLVP